MFYDRQDAGEKLAKSLDDFQHQKNVIVLAMPRGGVVVGKKVSEILSIPLDIVVTKKIPAPNNPEYAIGAISESGEPVLNEEIIGLYGINPVYLEEIITQKKDEITAQIKLYSNKKQRIPLTNKTVILIDDGIATGYTLLAAIEYIKSQHPGKIIIAMPVAPLEIINKFISDGFDIRCIEKSGNFLSLSQFYEHFDQISDEEVIKLLN